MAAESAPLLKPGGEAAGASRPPQEVRRSWGNWFQIHGTAHDGQCIDELCPLPEGRFVSKGSGRLCFWRCEPGALPELEGAVEDDSRSEVCLHPQDGRMVTCGYDDGAVRAWRLRPGAAAVLDKSLRAPDSGGQGPGTKPEIEKVCFLQDGRLASLHVQDDTVYVRIWHWRPGDTLEPDRSHATTTLDNYIGSLCLLSDGRIATRAFCEGKHWLQLWRIEDGGPLKEDARSEVFDGLKGGSIGVAALPDGYVAIAVGPRELQIWRVEPGLQPEYKMSLHNFFHGQDVNQACWIPGWGLLGCGDAGFLRLVGLDLSALETARDISASVDALECQERLMGAMESCALQDTQLAALLDWAQLEVKTSELLNSKYAQRMTWTYDAAVSMICSEHNKERTDTFTRAVQDHVVRLAQEEDLLERWDNLHLDDETAQLFAATPIVRSLLLAKYNEGPHLWFIFQSVLYACLLAIFTVVILQQVSGEDFRVLAAGVELKPPGQVQTSIIGLLLLSIASLLELVQIQALAYAELSRVPRYGGEENDIWVYRKKRFRIAPLAHIGLSRDWRSDPSNWIDVCLIANFWVVLTRVFRQDWAYEEQLTVAGIILMLLKALEQLQSLTQDFATFVPMLYKIFFAVKEFMIVIAVFLLSFGLIFHVRLGRRDISGNPWATPGGIFNALFMLTFLGDFDDGAFPDLEDHVMLILFILIMVVVMLNVLIALVSDAYDEARASAEQLYWRAQQQLVTQISTTWGRFAFCPWRRRTIDQKIEVIHDILDQEIFSQQSVAQDGRVLDLVRRVQGAVRVELADIERRRRAAAASEKKQADAGAAQSEKKQADAGEGGGRGGGGG